MSVPNTILQNIKTAALDEFDASTHMGFGTGTQFVFGHSTANSYGQMDGKTWSWGVWNKILSTTKIDTLYNSGTALIYSSISGGAAADDANFLGANF